MLLVEVRGEPNEGCFPVYVSVVQVEKEAVYGFIQCFPPILEYVLIGSVSGIILRRAL